MFRVMAFLSLFMVGGLHAEEVALASLKDGDRPVWRLSNTSFYLVYECEIKSRMIFSYKRCHRPRMEIMNSLRFSEASGAARPSSRMIYGGIEINDRNRSFPSGEGMYRALSDNPSAEALLIERYVEVVPGAVFPFEYHDVETRFIFESFDGAAFSYVDNVNEFHDARVRKINYFTFFACFLFFALMCLFLFFVFVFFRKVLSSFSGWVERRRAGVVERDEVIRQRIRMSSGGGAASPED